MPQIVEHGVTSLGQTYEVNFENGVKVLNSEKTNYSFGSLHQIMLKGIEEVLRNKKCSDVLMLGLGAGSAISILENKCSWPHRITAVEIDNDLIEIASKHFDLNKHEHVSILNGDASKVIHELNENAFDLIIDDVFWDDDVPSFCREETFLRANARLLKSDGIYMRNVMSHGFDNMKDYELLLNEVFGKVYSIKHKTYGNRIFFCTAK